MDGSPGKRSLPSRSNRGVGPQRLSSQEEWNRLMECRQLQKSAYKPSSAPGQNCASLNELINRSLKTKHERLKATYVKKVRGPGRRGGFVQATSRRIEPTRVKGPLLTVDYSRVEKKRDLREAEAAARREEERRAISAERLASLAEDRGVLHTIRKGRGELGEWAWSDPNLTAIPADFRAVKEEACVINLDQLTADELKRLAASD